MAFNTNFINLMNGYTALPTTEGPGEEDPKPKLLFKLDSAADNQADARDTLSFLTGGGYTSLSDDDAKGAFKNLAKTVGPQLAQKLATQVFLFNQRSDAKGFNPEQRITNFYESGSNDKEVNNYLNKTKAFGKGILAGYKDSVLTGNQALQGKALSAPVAAMDMSKINEIISKTTQQ